MLSCNTSHAQGFMKKLLKGSQDKEETILDTIPISLDKNLIFYPCKTVDEKIIASGNQKIAKGQEEIAFINAILYAIDKAERGKEHIVQIDYDKKVFSVVIEVSSKFYPDNSTYYKYANTFHFTEGNMSFQSTEMHVCYKNLMGDLKENTFENLNPQKKAKHKNYVNELATSNSIYINGLTNFILTNQPESINHWDEIKAGTVVKGMNITECLLSIGKPMHERKNGNQTKWMVNNDFVIIFEDGKVINIIR